MIRNNEKDKDKDKDIQCLLQSVFPPADQQLRRDLWPAMLNRMQTPSFALPWYDWALLAALGGWAVIAPQGILQLLYQL